MPVAQKLPLVYTSQQLLDMCARALKSADECQSEAALVRGRTPQIRVVGDDEQARLIEDMTTLSEELDARAKNFVRVAREYAEELVGQELILTGIVYYDATVYNSNNHCSDLDEIDDMLIGCGTPETITREVTLDRTIRTVMRVKLTGGYMMSSNKAVFFFDHDEQECYFIWPLRYGVELRIETL